jgi:hypothetical protein
VKHVTVVAEAARIVTPPTQTHKQQQTRWCQLAQYQRTFSKGRAKNAKMCGVRLGEVAVIVQSRNHDAGVLGTKHEKGRGARRAAVKNLECRAWVVAVVVIWAVRRGVVDIGVI